MDIKEYHVNTPHEKQNHPWEEARFEVASDLLKKNIGEPHGKYLADIGCGDGFFISRMAERYPQVPCYAVDTAFTPELMEELKGKYALDNLHFCRESRDIQMPDGSLGVVFAMDVIEHVEDDISFLSSMRNLSGFGEQTRLLVTVPAFQNLYCSHDKWLGHYRRYSVPLLRQHLVQAGFTPLASGYFFSALLLPRLLRVAKERLLGAPEQEPSGIGDWNGSEGVTRLVKKSLWSDYRVTAMLRKIGITLPGLSCWCIAR